MIEYGLDILPCIREIQPAHPQVTKPWYAGNSGAGGSFAHIQCHLEDLMVRGPPHGYSPDTTKSILFVLEKTYSGNTHDSRALV